MRRDGTGKCPVKWFINELGEKKWICSAHFAPYTRHKEKSEKCWYSTCPGRSMAGYPLSEEELKARKSKQAKKKIKETELLIQTQESAVESCNNYGCVNKVASSRKRYCSDKCRLQKSRSDYELRNPNRRSKPKVEKRKELPVTPPKPFKPESVEICTSTICENKVTKTRKVYCSDNCRKRAYRQRRKKEEEKK